MARFVQLWAMDKQLTLGEAVRLERNRRKISQAVLARQMGLAKKDAIGRIERGRSPLHWHYEWLCKWLGTPAPYPIKLDTPKQ